MASLRNWLMALPQLLWQGILGTLRYIWMLLTLASSVITFLVLNWTTIVRTKDRKPLTTGTIILSNHQSFLDSFVFSLMYMWTILVRPWLQPWHCADKDNFVSAPGMRPLAYLWKIIPIDRKGGRGRNTISHRRVLKALQSGTVHIYLEGGRAKTEEMDPPKIGVAKIILLTGAKVKLAAIRGMHAVQPYKKRAADHHWTLFTPIGRTFAWVFHFRIGKRVGIVEGPTLSAEEVAAIAGEGADDERAERLAWTLWHHIRELKESVPSARSAA